MPVTDCTELRSEDGAVPSAADLAFLSQFESCSLPESEWTHLAHIRVAWICLAVETPERALARIRAGILRYNTEVLGRRHQYHETVTIAFTRLVAHRMAAGEAWQSFAARIDDILNAEDPVLLRFYSEERLFSAVARQQYVAPDRAELPELAGTGEIVREGSNG
jgi:hypothetical protein